MKEHAVSASGNFLVAQVAYAANNLYWGDIHSLVVERLDMTGQVSKLMSSFAAFIADVFRQTTVL